MNEEADRPVVPDDDLTPVVGAATDVAPLGRHRAAAKPEHERTADEEAGQVDWEAISASAEFKKLVAAKRGFIVPATIFFVIYYFALPLLVGYAPRLMERKVFGGTINVAYLFALSQFLMTWLLAALYLRVAGRWDAMAARIVNSLGGLRRAK